MFELNLIREPLRSRKKLYSFLRVMLVIYAALALVFAALCARYLAGRVQTTVLSMSIASYERDIAKKDAEYNIPSLCGQWEKTLRDMLLVQNAVRQRGNQADRIRELVALLPIGICFRQIEVSPEKTTLGIIVAPVGRQEYDILNEYIGRLEKSPFFGKGARIATREKRDFRGSRAEQYSIVIPAGKSE